MFLLFLIIQQLAQFFMHTLILLKYNTRDFRSTNRPNASEKSSVFIQGFRQGPVILLRPEYETGRHTDSIQGSYLRHQRT